MAETVDKIITVCIRTTYTIYRWSILGKKWKKFNKDV